MRRPQTSQLRLDDRHSLERWRINVCRLRHRPVRQVPQDGSRASLYRIKDLRLEAPCHTVCHPHQERCRDSEVPSAANT